MNDPSDTARWKYVEEIPGYIPGSFTMLHRALSAEVFWARVLPTPDGRYDVKLDTLCWTKQSRIAFSGQANAAISYSEKSGDLQAELMEPSMWINSTLAIKVQGHVSVARWVKQQTGEWENLAIIYDLLMDSSEIRFPEQYLDEGTLAYTVSENGFGTRAVGWNLKTGWVTYGEGVFLLLGSMNSGDIASIYNPDGIGGVNTFFYQSDDGIVYGSFPLLDMKLDTCFVGQVWIAIPIWGTDSLAIPTRIIARSLNVNQPGGAPEFNIPQSPGTGNWNFDLPPDAYHVEVQFDPGFKHYKKDPSPKP